MFKRSCLAAAVLATLFQVLASSVRAYEPADADRPGSGDICVMSEGQAVSITLADVFAYHEHPCPGSCVAFRAVRCGIALLWHGEIPDRSDMVILSRGSMHGVLDVFALVTKGPILPKTDAITQASCVLKEMPIGRESFAFTIIRRSTGQVVELRVKETLYPKEFFSLRKKVKQQTASSAERERLEKWQHDLIESVPRLEESDLFEAPVQYRVLVFGA